MSKQRAMIATGPTLFTAAAIVASFATAAMLASNASANPQKVVDTTTSIYKCTLADGAIAYTDMRCKGATEIKRWQAQKIAPGITSTGTAMSVDMLSDQTRPAQQRDDPYVACRKIGGKYFVAAKLCKLPPEARLKIKTY